MGCCRFALHSLLLGALLAGCTTPPRTLMPTPVLYQGPVGEAMFERTVASRRHPPVDLLYITDRAPQTDPESVLPYGEARARRIAFGSAEVRMSADLDWPTLEAESRLATRDREIEIGNRTTRPPPPEKPQQRQHQRCES